MLLKLAHEIFFAVWFFLPAGIANMMPVFAARWPIIKNYQWPMDFNLTYKGKRVFGAHKTIRGLVVGIIFATITLWLQQLAASHFSALDSWVNVYVDYSTLPVLLLGPLFALGALLGDAVESFFKRQINIAPGDGWFPFDQTDYIIGGAIATVPFVTLTFWQYVSLIITWFSLHIIATTIGYFLGVKDKPI